VPTPIVLDRAATFEVVHRAQATNAILPYAPNRLILVLFPKGTVLTTGPPSSPMYPHAYHSAEAIGQYAAFVTADSVIGNVGAAMMACGGTVPVVDLVAAHEIFEAATDPAQDVGQQGWDEVVDACRDKDVETFINLSFGGCMPGVFDNIIQSCSKTGYDPVARKIAVDPSVGISFGQRAVGDVDTRSFTITNTGNADVTITFPPNPPPHPPVHKNTFTWDHVGSFVISPVDKLTTDVDFAPRSIGIFAMTLTIKDNAAGSPLVVKLRGRGVPGPPP